MVCSTTNKTKSEINDSFPLRKQSSQKTLLTKLCYKTIFSIKQKRINLFIKTYIESIKLIDITNNNKTRDKNVTMTVSFLMSPYEKCKKYFSMTMLTSFA